MFARKARSATPTRSRPSWELTHRLSSLSSQTVNRNLSRRCTDLLLSVKGQSSKLTYLKASQLDQVLSQIVRLHYQNHEQVEHYALFEYLLSKKSENLPCTWWPNVTRPSKWVRSTLCKLWVVWTRSRRCRMRERGLEAARGTWLSTWASVTSFESSSLCGCEPSILCTWSSRRWRRCKWRDWEAARAPTKLLLQKARNNRPYFF